MSAFTISAAIDSVKIDGLDAISGDERYTVVLDGVKDITGNTINRICVICPEGQDPDCCVFGKIQINPVSRTADFSYVNATDTPQDYAFIISGYSDNKLSTSAVKTGKIKADSNGVIKSDALSKAAVLYKAFLWEDTESLKPYVSAASIGASNINDADWIVAPTMFTQTSQTTNVGGDNELFYAGDIVRCWNDKNSNGKFDSGEFTKVKLGAAPIFRKEFTAEKTIANATVDVTGLGYYELYINGNKIGDKVLEPFESNTDSDCVFYSTYNVTDLITTGENAVGAILGRGTYNPDPDNDLGMKAIHRHITQGGKQRLKVMLTVEYTDGTYIQIPTDTTWKASNGPIRFDHQAYGEYYDSRMEEELGWQQNTWTTAAYDDSNWSNAQLEKGKDPNGTLTPAPDNYNTVINTYGNLEVEDLGNNTFRVDVGRVLTGWARINNFNCTSSGDLIELHYIENLNTWKTAHQSSKKNTFGFKDMNGDEDEITAYAQTDHYITHAGTNNWAPKFNFQSFRYIDITFPQTMSITAEDVKSFIQVEEIHANVEQTGSFESSDNMLNNIHTMAVNTMLNNMHSFISDTPLHENAPWLLDGAATAEWGMMNYEMKDYLENWLQAIKAGQKDTGEISAIAPGSRNSQAPEWYASYTELVWYMYQHTGDKSLLNNYYNSLKSQFEWVLGDEYRELANTQAKSHFASGISQLPEDIYYSYYGDHVPPEISIRGSLSCRTVAATAYVYHQAERLAQMATILGKADDVEFYKNEAADIKTAFNNQFWDKDKGYYHEASLMAADSANYFNQTPNLVAVDFGLANDEQKAKIITHLKNDIADLRDNGYSGLAVGMVGIRHFFNVLSDNGLAEEVYDVLTSEDFPGYGYWLANGLTSMCEHWYLNNRSDNHHAYGYVDTWFYRNVAGINPTAPGYQSSTIKPYILGDMTYANGSINTPYGIIKSDWTVDNGTITLTVTIPSSTTSTVYVPLGTSGEVDAPSGATESALTEEGYKVYNVNGGTYTFTAR